MLRKTKLNKTCREKKKKLISTKYTARLSLIYRCEKWKCCSSKHGSSVAQVDLFFLLLPNALGLVPSLLDHLLKVFKQLLHIFTSLLKTLHHI
ncbi:hypothetical protein Syun_002658 [Stephania yunnanensis]|uniref:Uncharacterized protein n=1 Tax=Stephania yunnanensis TaxID=152371 RepID=A0AAP0LFU0_9MAGN